MASKTTRAKDSYSPEESITKRSKPRSPRQVVDDATKKRVSELERLQQSLQDELISLRRSISRKTPNNELHKKLEEMTKDMADMEALNKALIVKQRQDSDELNEARKAMISGWKDYLAIGVKHMGDLDIKPFRIACYRKYPSNIADDKAAQLCSLWQTRLGDSNWYPFKVVHCGTDEEEEHG